MMRPGRFIKQFLPRGLFGRSLIIIVAPMVLLQGVVRWDHLAWALGLNIVWTVAAALVFAQQFRAARVRGALLSIGE